MHVSCCIMHAAWHKIIHHDRYATYHAYHAVSDCNISHLISVSLSYHTVSSPYHRFTVRMMSAYHSVSVTYHAHLKWEVSIILVSSRIMSGRQRCSYHAHIIPYHAVSCQTRNVTRIMMVSVGIGAYHEMRLCVGILCLVFAYHVAVSSRIMSYLSCVRDRVRYGMIQLDTTWYVLIQNHDTGHKKY